MRRPLAKVLIVMAVACGATAGWPQATPAVPTLAATPSRTQLASYAGKVRAAILPHILEPEGLEGNPRAEIKVTTRPSGEVVDAELTRSSGQPAWDAAVRRAVLKANRIPLDIDGTLPPVLYLVFSPR